MQPSLFTRLTSVEAELSAMKDMLVELKVNQDEPRRDRGRMAMAGGASACGITAGQLVAVAQASCCSARRCHSKLLQAACRHPGQAGRDGSELG